LSEELLGLSVVNDGGFDLTIKIAKIRTFAGFRDTHTSFLLDFMPANSLYNWTNLHK